MEIMDLLVLGILAIILCYLMLVSWLFYVRRFQVLEGILDFTLDYVANNEENQKLIYQLGGILGNGVKGGFGLELPKQRSGKFKWQDLVMEIIAQSFRNPSSPPLATSPQPPGQDILTQKNTDKW